MGFGAETLRRHAAALLASACIALPAVAQESPIRDQDRSNFETLYREKLTSVERTRATADDVTLATEMFEFAESLPRTDIGVRCLIYAQVMTLCSNTADLELMNEAYSQLVAQWAEQTIVPPEKLMQQASRGYRGVERRDREKQGEHYIEMLIIVAFHYEDANDPEQAIGVCRLASTVAKTIGSDQYEPIQAKLDRLAADSDMAKRIKMLELSVQKNPQNSPAARELVKLLVTKHNDPVAAATYVDSTSDEELIDLVKRCALGIEVASAATSMRVADWYISLSEDEDDEKALALLREARRWYERFFVRYVREDALARRVAEMDNLALLKIEKLIEANPELIGKNKDGWEPLVAPPFDAKEHLFGEAEVFEVDDEGEITIKEGSLIVPYPKDKAYEVRVIMTVNEDASEARPAIVMYLPVGKKRVLATRYFVDHFHIAQIDEVSETRLIEPAPGKVGDKCQLTFQIAETDNQLAFAMLYNGRVGVKWEGRMRELEEIDEETLERLPEGIGPVFFIRSNANVTLHAVEFKKRG